MVITVTKSTKRPELNNNDMDGVIEFQDLMGSSTVRGNPIDMDVLNSTEEGDFFNASGKKVHKGPLAGIKNARAQHQARKNLRVSSKAKARLNRSGALLGKANAKALDAKAKIEAAKAAGKDDGSAKIIASLNKNTAAPEEKGMSTGAKVGIAVGIAAVLGVIGFVIYKKSKKG